MNQEKELQKALLELDQLVGLDEVKKNLFKVIDAIEYDKIENKERIKEGKIPYELYYNMIFYGPPGTGKTTVANILARLLTAKGLLSNPEPVVLHASEFSGGQLDAVQEALNHRFSKCAGCVVVMDDFYEFNRVYAGGNIANEVFGAMMAAIDKYHENICFVLCGYEKQQMEKMFREFNPGGLRRFPFKFEFRDFHMEDKES